MSQAPIIDFLSLLYGAMLLETSAGIDLFADAPSNWRQNVAAALERFRRPDGGYARVLLQNSKGKTVLSALVDLYSKYPVAQLKFLGPVLPKDRYTLTVTVTGERGNWSDKRKNNYGSTGYFTRGVLFASGAYEHAVSDRLAVTGLVTHAFATDQDALSRELGLSRRRVDVGGTVSYVVAPALTVFGSLGRTVWAMDPDSTRLLASAGVAVNMR